MWICKRCGSGNSDNSEKCQACGQLKVQKSKETKPIVIAIVMSCILVGVVAGLWLYKVYLNGQVIEKPNDDTVSGKWVLVRSTHYYSGELSSQAEYRYGEYGRSDIFSVYYDSFDGTVTRRHIVFEYGDNGKVIRDITYDQDTGDVVEYTEYTRDQNGRITENNTYSADGTLLASENSPIEEQLHDTVVETYRYENGKKYVSTASEYDSNGNEIKWSFFDSDGSPFFITDLKYDDEDRVIERITSYYFLGQLQDRSEEKVEYDDHGDVIREVSVSQGTGEITVGEYTYDEYGNEIRYVSTKDGQELARTENEYKYYENGKIVDGSDSNELADTSEFERVLNSTINEDQRIIVHRGWVLGLTDKGTVLVAGGDNAFGSNMVRDWTNIVAIDAAVNGDEKTVLGLKKDGTVVSTGWNLSGEANVSDWSDIIQIGAVISNSYGLRSDGKMVAAGSNTYGDCNVDNITNGRKMILQEHSQNCTLVLTRDGTLQATGNQRRFESSDLSILRDVENVCLGWGSMFAVTTEGKVVSTRSIAQEISQWTDIQKVYAHPVYDGLVIGVRRNGTVVAYAGNNYHGEAEIKKIVETWADINDIVILMDYSDFKEYTVIGVKNDGTIVSTGGLDLSGFYNIRRLYSYDDDYTDFAYLVGVRNDGTVVSNDPAVAKTVAEWRLF